MKNYIDTTTTGIVFEFGLEILRRDVAPYHHHLNLWQYDSLQFRRQTMTSSQKVNNK